MEQRLSVAFASKIMGISLVVLLLSGCPSTYIKTTAGTFTSAGKDATKALQQSTDRLDAAMDAGRAIKIASDRTCPIQEERLFLREDANQLKVISAAKLSFPKQAKSPDCKKLIRCAEESAGRHGVVTAACKTACYSAQEAFCLAAFEASYAKQLLPVGGKPIALAPPFEEEMKEYIVFLEKAEYQRAGSVESKLVGPAIGALTQYLDLLGKVTEKRESEVAADAKKLSANIGTITDSVDKVREKKLSDESAMVKAKAQSAIVAIGKLAGTLTKMAKDANDEENIRKLVNENTADIEALIENLRNISTSNNYAAMIKNDSAMEIIRNDIQKQFESTSSLREAKLLLDERDKYKFSDGPATINSIDQVFKGLSDSHKSLVSLVNDPTDEQKRKIAEDRFENFKIIVSDVVDVVATVK